MVNKVPELTEDEANDIIRALNIIISVDVDNANDFQKRLELIKNKLYKTWNN